MKAGHRQTRPNRFSYGPQGYFQQASLEDTAVQPWTPTPRVVQRRINRLLLLCVTRPISLHSCFSSLRLGATTPHTARKDVMKCLVRADQFTKLDDRLSPKDDSNLPQICDGSYKISELILLASGFERADLADIFGVLQLRGGCCDCEVLYNVAESSRFKVKYWQKQSVKQSGQKRHSTDT